MEQHKGLGAALAALAVVAVAGFASLVLVAKQAQAPVAAEPSIGYTPFTLQTGTGSYTDSADGRQNLQAISERFASGTASAILQADSNGVVQRVAPSALTGAWTLPSLTVSGAATIGGGLTYNTEALTASNTIAVSEAGKFFYLSGATSTQTLPTSTPAGQKYTFYVGGAMSGNVTVVTNGAENVIDGTLIVAGAVVDCDAEDTITFVADGENVGDFFSLISTGSGWLLGESGALTAGKLTCTAT